MTSFDRYSPAAKVALTYSGKYAEAIPSPPAVKEIAKRTLKEWNSLSERPPHPSSLSHSLEYIHWCRIFTDNEPISESECSCIEEVEDWGWESIRETLKKEGMEGLITSSCSTCIRAFLVAVLRGPSRRELNLKRGNYEWKIKDQSDLMTTFGSRVRAWTVLIFSMASVAICRDQRSFRKDQKSFLPFQQSQDWHYLHWLCSWCIWPEWPVPLHQEGKFQPERGGREVIDLWSLLTIRSAICHP